MFIGGWRGIFTIVLVIYFADAFVVVVVVNVFNVVTVVVVVVVVVVDVVVIVVVIVVVVVVHFAVVVEVASCFTVIKRRDVPKQSAVVVFVEVAVEGV